MLVSALPGDDLERAPPERPRTRGQRSHNDVSLWYVLSAAADTITSYDQGEFEAIRWLTD
ncbi:hypothetical protein EJC51_42960 [Streptomyces aquilus]|uniref:Uncharacterized protein n=1 Tax=Streptomyces aquilus TaxID=2548456 RepID=A0A3S9ID18_9ACTN|nr:hypothetical protein [Streptomyces aquilus]AZP22261.1 hypothetical protein EJC51_42960 [Streptomyces aquilus]